MFEAMKFGSLLQKFAWNSQTLLPAGEAVAMATTAGARAMRLPSEGRIAEGGPADIVLVSRDAVCMIPLHSLASNLVYACSGGCVETVLCAGRVLMAEGIVAGEAEVRERGAHAAEALVRRAGGRS
jgi:5-methylthioadenosine/S-adenosylhomocysteine deaminase